MTDKVQKIIAEIKDRILNYQEYIDSGYDDEEVIKQEELKDLLNFIYTMQKEPKECMYSKDNFTAEDRKVLCEDCKEKCAYAIAGVISTNAQVKEEPASEDLEEVIRKYEQRLEKENPATEAYDFASAIRFGANWQKQQMMKDAIETSVCAMLDGIHIDILPKQLKGCRFGEKVKVLIIKEE